MNGGTKTHLAEPRGIMTLCGRWRHHLQATTANPEMTSCHWCLTKLRKPGVRAIFYEDTAPVRDSAFWLDVDRRLFKTRRRG